MLMEWWAFKNLKRALPQRRLKKPALLLWKPLPHFRLSSTRRTCAPRRNRVSYFHHWKVLDYPCRKRSFTILVVLISCSSYYSI